MLVSDLVTVLNSHLKIAGDCEVRIYPVDIGKSAEISEITYIVEENCLVLIGHH